MQVKLQYVRFCTDCEKKLAPKCDSCKKHPGTKPRVVALFGAPPVLKTSECGCVQIQCQRPGCENKRWIRLPRNGSIGDKNRFCSNACSLILMTEARKNSVEVPCSCGCGTKVRKHPSDVARIKHVYVSAKHFHEHRIAQSNEKDAERARKLAYQREWMRKKRAELAAAKAAACREMREAKKAAAKEAKRRAKEEDPEAGRVQTFCCNSPIHRGSPTDHVRCSNGKYRCTEDGCSKECYAPGKKEVA